MQGGIHPDLPGDFYFRLLDAVKDRVPGIHVHAFSPMEVMNGATRLGISFREFLEECAALGVEDLSLDMGTVALMGKGRRVRHAPIGNKTVRALDRYLRFRARHQDSAHPALWLGRAGPMTAYGIMEVVKRRAEQAGIGHVHVHQLRHSAAHYLRLAGADDDSVMRLMGWRDRAMLHRYGSSAADERARATHRRLGLGDRL
jgi:integrase/recombinase XerC